MKRLTILNQRVDAIKFDEVFELILSAIKSKKKSLFFATNIHNFVAVANETKPFRTAYEEASCIFSDGVPIIWIARMFGKQIPERVSGTDLTEKLLLDSSLNLYLIVSRQEIADILLKKFTSIKGYFVPPFGSDWNTTVNDVIISDINKQSPDVLLIGVGPLKQEKWLLNHFNETNAIVGIGVGSGLEIIAGLKKRAPGFLKNNGLEWSWRLVHEPVRLLPRYADDFIQIIKLISTHYYSKK